MQTYTRALFVLLLLSLTAVPSEAWQASPYRTIDASGHVTVYTYDSNGRLVSTTDAKGVSSHQNVTAPSPKTNSKSPVGPHTISGITIRVPQDQPTIQAAINAANDGDTVLVSDGTYRENISFNGKAITLTSVNGPATTIIDGGATNTVVTFNSSEGTSSVLSGFTIRNGYSNFNVPNFGDGGGIFISGGSPTITNNVITNNQACEGVGIWVHFGSPLIQGNTISNNSQFGCSGGIGGGIAIGGEPNTTQVIGNLIKNNSMPQSTGGGGIGLNSVGSGPLIQNNIISGNNGGINWGGGIVMINDESPEIVQNLIIDNTAGEGGGILWIIPVSTPGILLLNNTIAHNDSTSGSAIYDGGFDTNMAIQNNLIIAKAGEAAYFCQQNNGSTTPAVFANNDVFSDGGSAISGNCTVSTGSNGNISSDPLFVDAVVDNFHLQSTSPAVDAGNNTARIPLPATDLDGNPRIFNNIVDIGAYEFQPTTTSFSSTSLTFPPTQVGSTSAPLSITINNTGTIGLEINPIGVTGDFSENDNCHTSTGIAAGQSCTINVVFMPTTTGTRTGQFVVNSNDAAGPTTVNLSGIGGVPVVSLSSTSLAFGNQPLNTTSSPQQVTLTNTGNAPLSITGIAASGDFAQSNNCSGTVNAGAGCTITVTFTPTALGARNGAVTITDDATDSPQNVSLSGNGVAAIASLSPSSLTFAAQQVGTSSNAQTVTVTNSGNIPLNISSITLSGANSGDFSQVNNCGSVAPNATCSINVTFTPTAIGGRSATLLVTDNAANSPQSVSLSGGGVGAIAGLSVNSINFGAQPVGSTSGAQSVVLINTGNIALTISSIGITGTNSGDFAQTNNCGPLVTAGSICTFNITFTPSAAGSRSATLAISDNSINGSPQTVTLAGIGTDFTISASPSTLTVAKKASGKSTITLAPVSGFNRTVSLSCSGAPPNSTCSLSPQSVTLNGVSSSTSQLTVTTTANTPKGTFTITISGSLGNLSHSTTVILTVK